MSSSLLESRYYELVRLFFLSCCIYGSTDYSLPKEVIADYQQYYGSKYIYLTNISLLMTIFVLVIGQIIRYKKISFLKQFYIHSLCIMIPLEGLVTILFWVLYMIDPTFLRNKDLYDQGVRFSIFTDLCEHLFPFLALLVEKQGVILVRSTYHIIFYGAFTVIYYIVISSCATLNGVWVYPFLDKLSTFSRIGMFLLSDLIVISLYYAIIHKSNNKKS